MQHPYAKALRAAATLRPQPRPPITASEPILEASDVAVAYKTSRLPLSRAAVSTVVVDGVSLTIAQGEIIGVVGESGSGKSTLARALLGLAPLTRGRVSLAGMRFDRARGRELRALRRQMQIVFQDPYGSLDPRQPVATLVAEPLHLLDQKLAGKDRRARIEAMLARVGLTASDADKFPHEFSGGQRQRIAIARALILEPKVIVLDEAVSALDVSIRAQIIELLRDLSARLGLAYLFITHDLAVVRALADRVLVMQDGKIVEEGAVADIFAAPKHPHTQALIAASPDLEAAIAAREQKAAQ
jgi:peptide/nickel transport system ATP-binding protein